MKTWLAAILVGWVMLSVPASANAQSTEGWLTYNGTDFWVNYPPDWVVAVKTSNSVGFTNTDMEMIVTETTKFGTNLNEALAAVEAFTQQFATEHGYSMAADPVVPGDTSASELLTLHLTGTGLAPQDFKIEALQVNGRIFLLELIGTPDEVFSNQVTVLWPMADTIHSLIGQSVTGSWKATATGVASTGSDHYAATLQFTTAGTYTYDVSQTNAPEWQIHVAGSYTVGPAAQNNDNYALAVDLNPQAVTESGVPDLHTADIGLFNAGLPIAEAETANQFFATVNTDGTLSLVRAGASAVTYQPVTSGTGGGVSGTVSGSSPLRFVPITPCRVADTRTNSSLYGSALAASETRTFSIALSSCGVPSTAEAYSLNVTAVPKGALRYLTIWPSGQPQPYVSTLNSTDGRVKANAVLIGGGNDGAVNVFGTDPTDVVLDINGYFVPENSEIGLTFYPVTPCRVLDTRNAYGILGGPMLAAGQTRTVPVTKSNCALPQDAQAFAVNVTAVPNGPLAYLSAWPTGIPRPYVSTLNAPTGVPTANAAIIPNGSNGSIDVYVSNASHVVMDVVGYFATPSEGGLSFYGLAPCRLWDTRTTGTKQPLVGSASVDVVGGACNIPSTAKSVVLNATAVPRKALGYLSLWPEGEPQPHVSTLNSWDGSIVSNLAIVPLGAQPENAGAVEVFNSDAADTILDVTGYFAP